MKFECKINLAWVPSKQNKADACTREDEHQDISLTRQAFRTLLNKKGPFHRDLMSSFATTQKDNSGQRLPYFSQYFETQALSTDVFAQDLERHETEQDRDKGFFLQHLLQCKGWCVVVIPIKPATWTHIMLLGQKDRTLIAKQYQKDTFLMFKQKSLTTFQSKFEMVAVELDFRDRKI